MQGNNPSRVYKAARDLFLTQHFGQAFDELSTVIDGKVQTNEDVEAERDGEVLRERITVAKDSLRTKIWSLYLTLLHTLHQAGDQQACNWIGAQRWHSTRASIQDGSIWEYVIRAGFDGDPAVVDREIYTALITLCLLHPVSSRVCQVKIEALLSSGEIHPTENLDGNNVAKLNQLVELFVLHILPSNQEWEYARAFVEHNDHLDPDNKARYRGVLDFLESEASKSGDDRFSASFSSEDTVKNYHEQEALQDATRTPQTKPSGYMMARQSLQSAANTSQVGATSQKKHGDGPVGSWPPVPRSSKVGASESGSPPPPMVVQPAHKSMGSKPYIRRNPSILTALRNVFGNLVASLQQSPHIVLRVILVYLFIRGLLSSHQARVVIRKWTEKVRQTVMMGTKVSYV